MTQIILIAVVAFVAGWSLRGLKDWVVKTAAALTETRAPEYAPVLDEEAEAAPAKPHIPEGVTRLDVAPSPEKVERDMETKISDARANYLRLSQLDTTEIGDLDLPTALAAASREYGESYFAKYQKAPPEWGGAVQG